MNMTIRKPTHPGKLLLETVIKPSGITITEAAKRLGVTRKALNDLVHEKANLSITMSLRIAEATGTSPESWYEMQVRLDMWKALQHKPKNIHRFKNPIPA